MHDRHWVIRITGVLFTAALLLTTTGCEKALNLKDPAVNATAVFDELWTVMDKHYSLFPYKGVNWDSAYGPFRAKVRDGMPETELFGVLSDMLAALKDGHVTLTSSIDTFTYLGFYKPYPYNFNYENIVNTYLQHAYSTSGPLIYKISSGVGYLYYKRFANDVTDQQIDKVLTDMAQTKGLIIDVRDNTGGSTANADRMFQRFITARTLVKFELSKKGPGHDDYTAPQPYYISPAGVHYGQPIVVLTNRACFSACNDFVLYLSGLQNVTQIGDQTGGGGGIPGDYLLSNGWKLQYTATVTLSSAKAPVENGIVPDIPINISPSDESNGKDPILEKAFQSLQ
ncbi:S41 family peptidase [Flavitalea sp. BT771]|uniref:S41 family peptidase n=1 Tax=Flavitalea sp. BT771 TaxID=3063329 RepID=UPI0026E239D0|nr:S41 family peptidase [Flavitalea sp. BT771]MDO6430394.1 S41 family peptidase [Flavitalea sp. BT771]MDV6219466.1 S41 family peptidase [Flavitalea sp. BT771]